MPASAFVNRPLFFTCRFAMSVFAGACAHTALAQDKVLEEVIVTSQKRAESIMDVPISVAAVTGEKIEKAGIENIEDLTAYVPNIHLTETGLSTQLRIRGVGSDNSQGFEQSVGVYKDGVFNGRAQLFRAPIFDVERVEVMRGPQNTLFGKNSVAGALDIITAKPDDEFSGKLTASYETEYATQEYSGYITGPLSDSLNARIAVRYYDDPGYMVNTFKNEDEPNTEEASIRASLDWAATDSLNLLLIAEHNTFDVQGRAIETTLDSPSLRPDLMGAYYYQVVAQFNGGITFDPELNYERQTDAPEFSDNTIDSGTLVIDYDFNGYTFTATTGYLSFDYTENCDCDFTPAPFFNLDLTEDYEQFSQEFRISSPLDDTFEWLAGGFFQTYDQEFYDRLNITDDSTLITVLSASSPGAVILANTGVRRNFTQSSDAWALFGEATWHIQDDFHLVFGARFTQEDKDSTKVVDLANITDGSTVTGPVAPSLGMLNYSLFGVDTEQTPQMGINLITMQPYTREIAGHNLEGNRDESAFMPSITVKWDANDEIMTYLKFSKGFKAGGFDPRSNNNQYYEFEDESVTSVELGSKWVMADGASELNWALFHTDYLGLQTSQFDGYVGFNVGNADAVIRGLEIDGRWLITEHWLASYGAAYLDFEYTDYRNGNCYFGQPEDSNGFCDNTGKSSTYIPRYTFNGTLEYTRPLNSELEFVTILDMQWVDEQQVHNNLDPRGVIDPYTLLSLRLGVEAERWGVALLGKNLLDEDIITYSSNMPLAETIFFNNAYYSYVRRPLTVAVEATLKF